MSLNNRESLIWKERDRMREGVGQAGRSGGGHILGKVRFGRDRGERQRYREIETQRNKET
jgi:hypothetical protein